MDGSDEIEDLISSLKHASENGLLYEFLEFFLFDYKKNHNVREAIWYATCEWDL